MAIVKSKGSTDHQVHLDSVVHFCPCAGYHPFSFRNMRVFEHVLGATEEMPSTDILHAALLNAIRYELSIGEKTRPLWSGSAAHITSEACRKDLHALVQPTVRTNDRDWSSVPLERAWKCRIHATPRATASILWCGGCLLSFSCKLRT